MIELRDSDGLTEKEFLAQYDLKKFEQPSVTVDMVVFTVKEQKLKKKDYRKLPRKQLKILLIKRLGHPYIQQWGLPGGFVKKDETTATAALRELQEETGVKDIYMEQQNIWSNPGRDPRCWIISVSYMALIDAQTLQAGTDAAEAEWFDIDSQLLEEVKTEDEENNTVTVKRRIKIALVNDDTEISSVIEVMQIRNQKGTLINESRVIIENQGLAFDHGLIIHYGLEQLRDKIERTDLAFNLVPELFTLTELQHVHEVILGTELLMANFRRKIKHKVVDTEQYKTEENKKYSHRPSKMYRFNPNWSDEDNDEE